MDGMGLHRLHELHAQPELLLKLELGVGQKTVERKTINRIPEECKSNSVWILDTLLGPTIDRSAQTTSRGQQ